MLQGLLLGLSWFFWFLVRFGDFLRLLRYLFVVAVSCWIAVIAKFLVSTLRLVETASTWRVQWWHSVCSYSQLVHAIDRGGGHEYHWLIPVNPQDSIPNDNIPKYYLWPCIFPKIPLAAMKTRASKEIQMASATNTSVTKDHSKERETYFGCPKNRHHRFL